MTFEQFTKALFEEHWVLATFLVPEVVALWAIVTKQYLWLLGCVLLDGLGKWGRDRGIVDAVAKRLGKP
jgi:hypothetical protein